MTKKFLMKKGKNSEFQFDMNNQTFSIESDDQKGEKSLQKIIIFFQNLPIVTFAHSTRHDDMNECMENDKCSEQPISFPR